MTDDPPDKYFLRRTLRPAARSRRISGQATDRDASTSSSVLPPRNSLRTNYVNFTFVEETLIFCRLKHIVLRYIILYAHEHGARRRIGLSGQMPAARRPVPVQARTLKAAKRNSRDAPGGKDPGYNGGVFPSRLEGFESPGSAPGQELERSRRECPEGIGGRADGRRPAERKMGPVRPPAAKAQLQRTCRPRGTAVHKPPMKSSDGPRRKAWSSSGRSTPANRCRRCGGISSPRSSTGEFSKAEIAEALERSLRRKNTRIPVAFQSILVKALSATGSSQT